MQILQQVKEPFEYKEIKKDYLRETEDQNWQHIILENAGQESVISKKRKMNKEMDPLITEMYLRDFSI